jgi:hypothetical protein
MTLPPATSDRTLHIYLSLAQYPILSTQMRARMRRELFDRGVITQQAFEAEAREKAIRSQALEGLHDPFSEEPADIWEMRLTRLRDHLTDFYFAYNLPYDLFEKIVRDTLSERGAGASDLQVSFNPELAPQNMLFDQAMSIEKMPPVERVQQEARLREIKVVLIRTMISDQLAYLKIAKDWFTIADLNDIRAHKIGQGKIGGKSAGMLLAARILMEVADDDIRASLRLPESYFLGADLTYTFMALNGLMPWGDQKYKLEEQIRAEYPKIQSEFLKGEFPADILEKFRGLLSHVGRQPLIVRSSSLLEDNFGTSFAGKYDSFFCPNQGTPRQNLRDLTQAIIRIYASMLNPDALLYRRAKGLQDYDERMAILIQVVQGEQYGRYYLPHAAGVGFSRNLYRWSPQIRKEEGFIRLVWGLGTRAVDRVGNDYPRLVALSHPLLHPESAVKDIRHYSQQYVDLIDLQANAFKTLPMEDVLRPDYPVLRYLAQIDHGDYLSPVRILLQAGEKKDLVLTFDDLMRRTPLAKRLSKMLQILETHYHAPVDTEFTVRVVDPASPHPEVEISLLQCRPQSHIQENEARLPTHLNPDNVIFSTRRMAPEGRVSGICYVLYVPPQAYYALPTPAARAELGRVIGLLNAALKDEIFICVGPGRWGTSTPDLGVRVGYADIYNARALIELTGEGIGAAPEASFGTHFFQDLVESNIYPLAIYLDDEDVVFNRDFFDNTPNCLARFLPDQGAWEASVRLIEVASYRAEHSMELVMDDQAGKSVAYLERNP